MKFLTFVLILGVGSCALAKQIKPSASAKLNPLNFQTTAPKMAKETLLLQTPGISQDYDYIGDIIAALRRLDWNRVIDAFEVYLRNSRTHILVGLRDAEALELSGETVNEIISNLPNWASSQAIVVTEGTRQMCDFIISMGIILGFPEEYIAFSVSVIIALEYGVMLPFSILWENVADFLDQKEPGLGERVREVYSSTMTKLQNELDVFLQSLYQV